jgi:hypothetical protein
LLIGRHSAISTVSPSLASLTSSWACSTVRRLRNLPYFSCRVWYATTTLMVLLPLSEATTPRIVRSSARGGLPWGVPPRSLFGFAGFVVVCCFAMVITLR